MRKRIDIKKFQQVAIDELQKSFLKLWEAGNYNLPITFKAPTGSGKTIMMAEFLRTLDGNFIFDVDKAYVWISFGGDASYTQSKQKLYDYFNQGTDMGLKDASHLSEKKLYKNNIFFINWAKIKATDKESRELRKQTERQVMGTGGIFDNYIKTTHADGRDIVLIIDEAHMEEKTKLAEEVKQLINPRIIIKVTATPEAGDIFSHADVSNNKAGYVEVPEQEVMGSGLIKSHIIIQTEEDIITKQKAGLNQDETILALAYEKRLQLKELYQKIGKDINPLTLIQLPNDEKKSSTEGDKKIEDVKAYLYSKGVKPEQVAVWLSGKKENFDTSISINNSPIDFLIFKQTAATGWDCPRASVLAMFREIRKPTFYTQVLGRIKRMPEAKHYDEPMLNHAYVFTNYNKQHLKNIDETDPNKPAIYFPVLKDNIKQIEFKNIYHKRTDFNTITPPDLWQRLFLETLDKEFGTKESAILSEMENNRKAIAPQISIDDTEVKTNIIVNADIESYDGFIKALKEKAGSMNFTFSKTDVEKFYNSLCFDILKKQEDDDAKYNPSRSWGQLKEGLNVWFRERFGLSNLYPVIVNELARPDNSKLRSVITIALVEFRKNYESKLQEKQKEDIYELLLPIKEISFTEDYEIKNVKKNCYNEFYLLKSKYLGKENETGFIDFIDNEKNIEWWHKQGNHGRENLAIEYTDKEKNKTRLFYPDFIIKTKKTLFILDTKSGNTISSQETKDKLTGLRKWLKNNKNITAGIVRQSVGNYEYTTDLSNWELLNF